MSRTTIRALRTLSILLQDPPPSYDRTGYDIGRRVRWRGRNGDQMRGIIYGSDRLTMPASEFGAEQSSTSLLVRDDGGDEWSIGAGVALFLEDE